MGRAAQADARSFHSGQVCVPAWRVLRSRGQYPGGRVGGSGAREQAAQGRLKITDIKTVVVNAQMRNWVFVKVETDTPGLDGWGEASLEWKTRAVAAAVEDLKPFILGDDPTRIEHIYQKLYRQPFFRPGVIGLSAISGIEQACWDILGKQLGVPVYKLLGGAVRDKVRMYTHLGGGEMSAVYESFDASRVIELALEVVARGYTAVKVVFVPYSEPLMGAPYAKKLAAVMGRLREAVGDRVDIMVDFHGRTYPAVAIEYINAIAEYRPYFCEEPVPPENIDGTPQSSISTRLRSTGLISARSLCRRRTSTRWPKCAARCACPSPRASGWRRATSSGKCWRSARRT